MDGFRLQLAAGACALECRPEKPLELLPAQTGDSRNNAYEFGRAETIRTRDAKASIVG